MNILESARENAMVKPSSQARAESPRVQCCDRGPTDSRSRTGRRNRRVGWPSAAGPKAGLAILGALALTACATTSEPRIVTKEVKVPVPVACAVSAGEDPIYPDSDEALKAAPNVLERVKLLAAGRLLRIAREMELKAAVKGCS